MSTRIARLVAVAVSTAAFAAPATATAQDLRGEFAQGAGGGSQVPRGVDLRGESSASGGPAQSAQGADVRGEFAKSEYRADTPETAAAPAAVIEPADSPSALPFIVSGLVLVLGFAAIAIVVPLRRRIGVGH